MSDMRFTMLGIGLIFVGFIVLGLFGTNFFEATVEAAEFDDCFEYFEDRAPEPVECEKKLLDKTLFFALVMGLIIAGIVSLIKGVKGNWDQNVRPEDMVAPGGSDKPGSDTKS